MVEQNTPVISKVTLPSNTTYWFKDTDARNAIEQLEAIIGTATGAKALVFKGVSSTELTDDGHEGPTINNTQIDPDNLAVGDIYFYNGSEFIWGPNPDYDADDPTSHQYVWHELGNLSGLGGLAYKNNVTGSTAYQPAGTVTVNVTTSAHTYLVSSTIGAANYTPAGSVGSATFTGTTATINMSTSYTPAGSVGSATFTGTTATINMSTSYTPAGSVGSATFTGTTATIAMSTSYQPAGTVSKPSVQLATNGAGTTTYIDNPTARQVTSALATAAPSATAPANEITYYSVSSETLSLYKIGYSTTMSIETTSVTVKTGDGAYQLSAAPTFTGTTATIETSTSYQPAGTNSTASFTGTEATISTSTTYQPAGTNSTASFTGTAAIISTSTTYQPAGTNSTATFTGTGVRLATGPVTLPETITATFTGTTATIEITAS